MKRIITFCFLISFVWFANIYITKSFATVTIPPEEPTAQNYVKVSGNHFVDEKGNTIVFRGLCFSDADKLAKANRWNEVYFDEAKKWGANVVRFCVHPDVWRSRGKENYLKLLDDGVKWAKARNLYVILDWHSIGNLKEEKFQNKSYITTLKETFEFWRIMAQRYKNEPIVALYELYNEPTVSGQNFGKMTWPEWKLINEQMIDTIRTYHPQAVALVAGFDWAYNLEPVKNSPIARQNVGYISHPYPMKVKEPWEEKWERDFGFVADKYPVVCTEIGFCLETEKGAHVPVKSTEAYGKHIVSYLHSKGISWTAWVFDAEWSPMLFSDWNFTPTTQGKFFKKVLQEKITSFPDLNK